MTQARFCNAALVKELFKRNWYISGLYLLGWLLVLIPSISRIRYLGEWDYYQQAGISLGLSGYLPVYLTFSALLTLVYCIVATCANCDYLFKTEAARFYGATSLSRQALLLSSLLTTLLPGVLVNVISGALFTLVENGAQMITCIGPVLIVSGCLLVVVLSGICLLCAVLSSSRFVFVLLTLMVHGYVYVLDSALLLAKSLFSYGVTTSAGPANIALVLSPFGKMISTFYTENSYWLWLGIYTVVSIVAICAACVLYKFRHFEAIGEGLAFKKLRPLFSILFSFAFGLGFALIGCAMVGATSSEIAATECMGNLITLMVFFLVGTLACYVVVESILAKSPRIITKRAGGAAVLVALCIATGIGAFQLGVQETNYVPPASEVKKVSVEGVDMLGESSEIIEAALDLHQEILNEQVHGEATNTATELGISTTELSENSYYNTCLQFTYLLNNNTTVQRSYVVEFTRENSADASTCQGKAVQLASSTFARQSRVDWLYALAEDYGSSGAANVTFYSSASNANDSVSVDVSLTGNDLKQLLDHSLASEICASHAYDPAVIAWLNETNAQEEAVAYLTPKYNTSYDNGNDPFQIWSSLELSSSETPQSLAWLTSTMN